MADAYSLAQKHLDMAVTEAAENNIDPNALGQALVWKVIELYQKNGRDSKDIVGEIQYTLDNINDDNTFHVSRN